MIEVSFLNLVSGSSSVRRRTFECETVFAQWLDGVRGMVEIISTLAVAK